MHPFFAFPTSIFTAASEQIALRSAKAEMTYGQLEQASGRMAAHLLAQGMERGGVVAIAWPRSFEQIVAALAVMRAGAAYVPMDPGTPLARVKHILADSGATVLVGQTALFGAELNGVKLVDLEAAAATIAGMAVHKDDVKIDAETLAYIIYTSGSTGVPKGVEVTHGNLAHLIDWHCEAFAVTKADRASHLAGLGFDASVWEVWPYLAVGACVSLVDEMARTSPVLLREWMVREAITVAFVPTPLAEPMMAEQWAEETSLRFLLTGGDTLHTAPRPGQPFVVVNNYGPTECTVVATSGVVLSTQTGLPTLGKAIKGTQAYVLNERGAVAAVGEVGELVLGGTGVARGYRNQPELTARSFVADHLSGVAGARLYKTGDRAALQVDGEFVFHGRMDGQEKIRGQRLELDEVTCVLNRHSAIAFSVVVARGEGEQKHLVAYVLPNEGVAHGLMAQELQEFLAEDLPSYMIPAKFARLMSIPLSANGKVDATLLPAVSEENALQEAVKREPSSPTEATLLTMVQTLLQNNEVGVNDDFFLIGGHSLMGTRLVMRIRETFGVNLMLRDLFEAGTVVDLANRIETLIYAELEAMSEEDAIKLAEN